MFSLLIIGFLLILAIVLLSIGIGWRWMETRRKAQMAGKMIATAAGKDPGMKVTVLRGQAAAHSLGAAFRRTSIFSRLTHWIEQAGTGWTRSASWRSRWFSPPRDCWSDFYFHSC